MSYKQILQVGLVLALSVYLFGCGKDKNLEPEADLVLLGADPPTLSVDANPPLTRVTYFLFKVQLSDPTLSMVGKDAWTVDRYSIHYTLVGDPAGHLLALPADVENKRAGRKVNPGVIDRLGVTVVEDTYLLNSALGFSGTSDRATVQARFTFKAHRNFDGAVKHLEKRFLFQIGDF